MIKVGDKIKILLKDSPYVEEGSIHEVSEVVEVSPDVFMPQIQLESTEWVYPVIMQLAEDNYEIVKDERPSFDEIFMKHAELMSQRSTCKRLKVGAVLVTDRHPTMGGYNGSIRGHEHCTDEGCLVVEGHCKRTIHAETNVLLSCAREGIPTKGATMYVTAEPCPDCLKHIAQAGIVKVIYRDSYPHKYDNDFARDIILEEYKETNK